MRKRTWFVLTALVGSLGLGSGLVRADVKPNPLFSDGMVLQRDRGVPVWGTADAGERVTVQIAGQSVSTTADDQGRWSVRLAPMMAGGPLGMTIAGKNTIKLDDVLVGEVWIASGQSNMQWSLNRTDNADAAIAKSANPRIRLFHVPRTKASEPAETVDAQWQPCVREYTAEFSAVAYFFARDLQQAINVPVGLIHTSWGGSPAEVWMSQRAIEEYPDGETIFAAGKANWERYGKAMVAYEKSGGSGRRPGLGWIPTELYNGMIAPLIPYAFRGAIWYQGESNASRAYQYRSLFPAMISNWRNAWGQGDFPFLLVQLAPFRKIKTEPTESDWAELREAQLLATQVLPNVGMAVITDVGEEDDIHPRKKAPVGARLALAARRIAYGEPIVHAGPTYASSVVDGHRVILRFRQVGGGLVARDGRLEGFTVAGPDRVFVNAEARIRGRKVVVRSPKVPNPVAVRYGWADYPTGNLWNTDGLPATPFRTDSFPITTGPRGK